MGFQAGFAGKFGSTSGFKLDADYAYKFHPFIWFNANIANVFGFGSADGFCAHSVGGATCYRGGWALELDGRHQAQVHHEDSAGHRSARRSSVSKSCTIATAATMARLCRSSRPVEA